MTRKLLWCLLPLLLVTQTSQTCRFGSPDQVCSGQCASIALESSEVERIVAQGVVEAQRLGVGATIVVVDRVGNVLAAYQVPGGVSAPASPVEIGPSPYSVVGVSQTLPSCPQREPKISATGSGLEGVNVAHTLAAISKAGTAAYLSSQGNAFTPRTASQIVQEHFVPLERNRPGGPLFGVQFSSLPCGDLVRRLDSVSPGDGMAGPKRLPLGLSADPGALPLYIWGVPVGGVGVEYDGCYDLDPSIFDFDIDLEERIAGAASQGFEAPRDRRADRIAVDGRFLRFADDLAFAPRSGPPPSLASLPGSLVDVDGWYDAAGGILDGALYQTAESGIEVFRFRGRPAERLVTPTGVELYPPTDSIAPAAQPAGKGMTAIEVELILDEALRIANRARAQIRRPLNTDARVTISVVDRRGNILGIVRALDAPIFGIDVSLQKARTAAFFSSPNAGDDLRAAGLGSYVSAAKAFLGPNALEGGIAFSDRAGGNLSRPFFPDGIDNRTNGPFSLFISRWSPFSTGLQLDADLPGLVASLTMPDMEIESCTDPVELSEIPNGLQIFPGSVPIYRAYRLVGGIGISGDGVDQDDMIAFLGLHNAGLRRRVGVNNAPPTIRADNLTPQGLNLRYVNCPVSPFIGSNDQSVCDNK